MKRFVCICLFPYLVTMYALAGIGPNLSCGHLTTVQPPANPMFGHIEIDFCKESFFFAMFFFDSLLRSDVLCGVDRLSRI